MDRQLSDSSACSTASQVYARTKRDGGDPRSGAGPSGDTGEWRSEVASRVEKYRVRRRRGFDPDLTLRLDFEAQRQANRSMLISKLEPARDADSAEHCGADAPSDGADQSGIVGPAETQSVECAAPSEPAVPPRPTRMRKIIEFPRPAVLFSPSANELAEPVLDTPRILEAPEIAPADLLPAVPAITLDTAAEEPPALDLELPLQPASLVRRGFAATLDLIAISIAYTLFGFVITKVAPIQPEQLKLRAGAFAAVISLGLVWAVYHYLFLVFGAVTPGMRAAGLEIRTFDARAVTRGVRRWRFISLMLSCVAAGLGFAWVLLDEDSLGWHDRMSHTYLAHGPSSACE